MKYVNKDSRLTYYLDDIGLQQHGCWMQDDPHSHSTKIDGFSKYKLGYVKSGLPHLKLRRMAVASRAQRGHYLGPEGLLMR